VSLIIQETVPSALQNKNWCSAV